MNFDIVQPDGWAKPKGYSNGIVVRGAGRLVFVAGQIAWDANQRLVGKSYFVTQFAQALRNVVAVVEKAGGKPEHIVRMTIYVTDKQLYLAATAELGTIWREIVGKTWPAMSLVQVAALLEDDALVEIEATATLP